MTKVNLTSMDEPNTGTQQASSGGHRPLKVMMIAPTSFFSDYGGHIRMLEETLALEKRGHQVTIVTYQQGRDLPGIDIRRTPALPYRADYEVGSSRHKVAFDIYLALKSLQVALQLRPDVIHGHMHEGTLIGAVLAKLLRVPLVFDFQGSLTGEMIDHGFLNPHGRIYPLAVKLEKMISNAAPAVLTSSDRARQLLRERFDVPVERLHALPDCVDMQRFNPALFSAEQRAHLKAELGIPADKLVISYLGLLADYQGTHHLVQAARKLKDREVSAHFLIMGYPNVDHYRQLAYDLDIQDYVTFTGKVPYDVAPLYLSLGDISVSAKMSETEGSGKVLNYMAMGQPIVAYDSQVHREYLADLGLYPPSGDVDAFTNALEQLLNDAQRRQQLGQALQTRVRETFSWRAAAEKIETIYYRLLKEGAIAGRR